MTEFEAGAVRRPFSPVAASRLPGVSRQMQHGNAGKWWKAAVHEIEFGMIRAALIALATIASLPAAVSAEALFNADDCYDLKIQARVIEQIPSEIPNCADCIIMSWPWFLDLKIRHILGGDRQPRVVRVLSVQHTYLKSRYGTWRLRKNAAGGLNVVSAEVAAQRCAISSPPTSAYIKPPKGESMDTLRAKGEKRYGRHSS
jgi:hypothetical protein